MSAVVRPRAAGFRKGLNRGVLAVALATALGGLAFTAPALAQQADAAASQASVDIPYESFTLPNGLRVIVHTDRKAPIVAVNVWYHVGSKDEPRGRTGFAHLFEHLMLFTGSRNAPEGRHFGLLEAVGSRTGTDINGTTSFDRTNYFQQVPSHALELALWLEADRMATLDEALSEG
ncbi:MAG: insulinase family protein, partial [Proteobacteria bacterium]|nr:insulinase family protein [Pseudomonadota bacterium]